jgi:hypothetical protein
MNNKRTFLIALVFLTIIVACAVPGLPNVSAPAPIDSNTISTIVVLTANAAITQTAAAPSPIPAETLPGLLETPVASLEKLPSESTKYTDHEAGFEVIFPAGWLTLRPNSEEFNAALVTEAVKNEMLQDQMELDLADYEPGVDRLYSYPLRPDIEKNFAFGFSKLKWDLDDPTRINENSMGQLVRDLESSGDIPGFRADTAQVYENGNQVKLIEVGGQFSISDGQGGVVPFYLTFVFFKPTNNSTVLIDFTYLKDYKLPIYADVTSVIASVKLLGQ